MNSNSNLISMLDRPKAGKVVGRLVVAAALGVGMFAAGVARAVPVSSLPDLSALTPYTTFGNLYSDSNVTVDGDAGISRNGSINVAAPSTITGTLYIDTGVTVTGPGNILDGIVSRDLSAAQALVFSASTTLRNLTPDVSLGNVNSAQTFNGNGAVKVINMNSLTLGSGNITLSGGASDYFVLNIAQGLSLTGSSSIVGSGIDASHILVNLYDSSGSLGLVAHVDDVINGTVIIPSDSATFHGIFGAIWSGNKQITLMSGAKVESVPFSPPSTVPDAGSSLALMSIGLGFLATAKRKFLS